MEIHHVGIAVENLEAAAQPYFALGYDLEAEERVESQGVRVWMLVDKRPGARIELLQSVQEGSAIGKFIEKRGSAMHHLAIATPDIEAELQRLLAEGAPLIDPMPRPGFGGHRVAFIHPKWAGGVLLELVQAVH